jgi:hypothetical protein
MNQETKYLAAVAMFCFFPTALVGLALQRNQPIKAIAFFYLSIYIYLFVVVVATIVIYGMGGNLIPVIGSFY